MTAWAHPNTSALPETITRLSGLAGCSAGRASAAVARLRSGAPNVECFWALERLVRVNLVAQPCLYRACILSHNIRSLAVEVLSGPCCLIHDAFNFGFGVAGCPADALLHLGAEISRA